MKAAALGKGGGGWIIEGVKYKFVFRCLIEAIVMDI